MDTAQRSKERERERREERGREWDGQREGERGTYEISSSINWAIISSLSVRKPE